MSLPDSWDAFTSLYLGTHADVTGTKGITSQEITSLIIDKYNRRETHTSQERGYYAKNTEHGKKRKIKKEKPKADLAECTICGRHNHPTTRCYWKEKLKCTSCGKFGHETSACWGNKSSQTPSKPRVKCTYQAWCLSYTNNLGMDPEHPVHRSDPDPSSVSVVWSTDPL
ncbi:hypothetical protein BDR03DRAFT_1010261 [Suillus americanus]|nr:hypothetical protein BDR03DRAFT_1010261 [Suillus americanus]